MRPFRSGIAFDADDNAYIVGYSDSDDYPATVGAYDISYNGVRDIILSKLSADGSTLVYSTFLGGSNRDIGNDITVDNSDYAYITGSTVNNNYPTTAGAYDTSHNGDEDIIMTKLSVDGTALVYSTFLGGGNNDEGSAIAVDADDNVYIAGSTLSSDYPTTASAYNRNYYENYDVVISKFAFLDHTVTIADTPNGPLVGNRGENLTYNTGSAVCNQGHDVEYMFDWGDGSSSAWSALTSNSHSYNSNRSYDIKVQARCSVNQEIVANWSDSSVVTIGGGAITIILQDPNIQWSAFEINQTDNIIYGGNWTAGPGFEVYSLDNLHSNAIEQCHHFGRQSLRLHELAVVLTGYGLYTYENEVGWNQLHTQEAENLTSWLK